MLDIKRVRENPDEIREGLKARNMASDAVDALQELDRRRRELLSETENLKNERNRVSGEIGLRRKRGEDTAEAQAGVRELGGRIAALDAQVREDITRHGLVCVEHLLQAGFLSETERINQIGHTDPERPGKAILGDCDFRERRRSSVGCSAGGVTQ